MRLFTQTNTVDMSNDHREISIKKDFHEISEAAAQLFVRLAKESVTSHGRFAVVLSGGSTPKALYERLVTDVFRDRIPWRQVHLFWGDERCVPPDHKDSNYKMAREVLIDKVAIPAENVHRIEAEKEPAVAAQEYEQTIRSFFSAGKEEVPAFDLIFLGMGEDGHTASLFPSSAALQEKKRWVMANYVEKLKAYRITLTAPILNQANQIVFLISGGSKAAVLKQVLEGPYEPDRLPSQLIRPSHGRLLFLVDQEAAGRIQSHI